MIAGNPQPNVVIVGAGPAGCAAALLLARRGSRVRLYEQAVFPRRKVCGGCLSGDAVAALMTLLGGRTQTLGTAVQRISFHVGRRRFSIRAGEHCRIVPRDVLDLALAEAASAAGAELHFGVRARILAPAPNRFIVHAAGEQCTPDWIVWAAGPHMPFAGTETTPPSRRLIGQALSIPPGAGCPPVGEIAMHWLRGGYVGLATVSETQCLVAWAAEAQSLAGRRPWDALHAANAGAAVLRDLALEANAGLLATAGFPIRPAAVGWGNLLLAGDAVGFEEPFSGEGIGQALRSGAAAAEAILAGGADEVVRRRYARRLGRHRRIRLRTRWLSTALRQPVVRTLLDSRLPIPAEVGQCLLRRIHVQGPV